MKWAIPLGGENRDKHCSHHDVSVASPLGFFIPRPFNLSAPVIIFIDLVSFFFIREIGFFGRFFAVCFGSVSCLYMSRRLG